jgi:hypothetical protein
MFRIEASAIKLEAMVAPKYLQIHLPGNMVSQPRRQQSSTQY